MSLSQDDVTKYKGLYLKTAKSYLQNMQLNISFLLKEEQAEIAIKQIHIDSHSLKSQSQIMGFNHIARIAEIIEKIFGKTAKENGHLRKELLIQIQADLTRLHDSLNEIEKKGKELDLTEVTKKLEKIEN